MSEELTGQKTEQVLQPKKIYRTRNLFLSALYNLITPGLGYYYNGDFKFAIIFALLYPFTFITADYISVHLPPAANSYFFILCYFSLIAFPVVHVIIKNIRGGKNKFYTLKYQNKVLFYVIFLVAGFLYFGYLKDLTFELHSITTPSMENTLMVGDRILVRYNHYGIYESLFEKRIFNFHQPQRNEIVVYSTERKLRRVVYLKRIAAIPHDTIKIIDKQVYINGIPEAKNKFYKYDEIQTSRDYKNNNLYPSGTGWNEDYYGPLYIPAKDDKIKIDSSNIVLLKPIIIKEMKATGNESKKYLEEIMNKGEYVVQNNYYFMMGDDRDNSLDSRYTGLVSEEEILGRAEFIVFNIYDWSRLGISLR